MTDNDIPYFIYDKTVANPTTENVAEALDIYRENGCTAIIGFGGGSSMDCAKAVGARAAKPKQPLSKMKGILKVRKRLPLLIAIPTTAGTGSETTLAAVITDAKTRHKYAINDFPLIPRYAVLDPKVTVSLPPSITASTGMDALTHAVEAFIGNSTTYGTRQNALLAVRLIFDNIDIVYNDGKNVDARRNMLHASFYAGCAFTKSYVGYVHAIAHSLGGEYNVPHGLANAVILPLVLESYGSRIHKKLHKLAVGAGISTPETPVDESASAFIQAIKDMKQRFNIGIHIPEINVRGAKQPTQINCAYTCTEPVKVDSVTEIPDLYAFFKEWEKKGRFRIKPRREVSEKEMCLVLAELQKDMQKHRLKEQPAHPMSVFLQKHFPEIWEKS